MNATTAVGDSAQRLRALQHANEVRLARANLKRQVAAGKIRAADVILDCPSQIGGMTVADLLVSQPRWGQARCRSVLTAVPLSETKTVGSMTERQRMVLAALLGEPPQPVRRDWSPSATDDLLLGHDAAATSRVRTMFPTAQV